MADGNEKTLHRKRAALLGDEVFQHNAFNEILAEHIDHD